MGNFVQKMNDNVTISEPETVQIEYIHENGYEWGLNTIGVFDDTIQLQYQHVHSNEFNWNDMFNQYNRNNIECKIEISSEKSFIQDECPISLEAIGSFYCKCEQCKQKFSVESYVKWINENNTCPKCRFVCDNTHKVAYIICNDDNKNNI